MAWTNNATEVGVANCDPDVLDANLTDLNERLNAVPDLINPDIIPLGNKATDFTLTENGIHTVNVTESCEMIKPTIATTTKFVFCLVEVLKTSGKSLTINNVKWDNDYVPTLSDTIPILIGFRLMGSGNWRASAKKGGA